ncbi:MAG: hypothetical protein EB127_15410, partial [Alphaproteobacteria bacterium]|nr:hypothetical protein [Alphaproteobacteria bacterium]
SRSANSRASASRISASKSAIATASRASAILSASIQQIPKNITIASNGIHPNIHMPKVNVSSINAAKKRSEHVLKTVKLPEKIFIINPEYKNVDNPLEKNTILKPNIKEANNVKETSNVKEVTSVNIEDNINPIKEIPSVISEIHSNIVNTARSRKEELLSLISIQPNISISNKKYTTIYITYDTLNNEIPVDQDALEELVTNISRLINTSNKLNILDEFNRYQKRSRFSIEHELHKSSIQKARMNKIRYLTSDT